MNPTAGRPRAGVATVRPASGIEAQESLGRLLTITIFALVTVVTVCGVGAAMLSPESARRSVQFVVLFDAAGGALLVLQRLGRPRLAGALLVIGLTAVSTLYAVGGGGLRVPAPSAFLVIMLLAGLLFGKWGGVITAAFLSVIAVALGIAESTGLLVPAPGFRSTFTVWLTVIVCVGGILAIQFIAVRAVRLAQRAAGERALALEKTLLTLTDETRKLHSILDNMAEAVVVADAAGRFVEFNGAAKRLHGIGPADVNPAGWGACFGLFGPDGRTACPPDDVPLHKAIRGIVCDDVELVIKRRDGSSSLVAVTARPILDENGTVEGGVVVLSDITERRRTLDALARSEERIRGILESVTDGFFTLDREWRYTYINPAAARFVGKPAVELIGNKIWDVFPEAVGTVFDEVYHRAMASGEVTHFEEYYAPLQAWAGGTVYPYEHGITVIFQDVTARKRVEAKAGQQLAALTALHAGARRLAESLDSVKLAEDAARVCVEVFGADVAWVGLAREDGVVQPLAQFPPLPANCKPVVVRWDESLEGGGPTGGAIRSGTAVIVRDVATDPVGVAWRQWAVDAGFRCAASFPLISRGTSFGSLTVCGRDAAYATPEQVEIFQTYAHEVAAALANARLYEETERRLRHAQALRKIDRAIASSLDSTMTFDIILDQVLAELGVDAADLLLLSRGTLTLHFAAGRGFVSEDTARIVLRLGEDAAGQAALERRTLYGHGAIDTAHSRWLELACTEGFAWRAAAPLLAKGEVKGVLEVFSRTQLNPSEEWLTFLETLAGQAAMAIDNASLFEDLQRSNIELTLAYDATIEGWSKALDFRDRETEGHTQRVAELTVRLARTMGMRDDELVHLRRGAMLHDIGKMAVPDSILHKPGPLSEEEWEVMRRHTTSAFEMLHPIRFLRPALDIPLAHHEKWDGTGYPRGRKGEQIPLAARIFSVVDVWDALRSDRPYRKALSAEQARDHIRSRSGTDFDPAVVTAFLALNPE